MLISQSGRTRQVFPLRHVRVLLRRRAAKQSSLHPRQHAPKLPSVPGEPLQFNLRVPRAPLRAHHAPPLSPRAGSSSTLPLCPTVVPFYSPLDHAALLLNISIIWEKVRGKRLVLFSTEMRWCCGTFSKLQRARPRRARTDCASGLKKWLGAGKPVSSRSLSAVCGFDHRVSGDLGAIGLRNSAEPDARGVPQQAGVCFVQRLPRHLLDSIPCVGPQVHSLR